ncbi:hypothetical protein Cgig2_020596 [Carnegiea gigantea]|uniref:Uncharacterized protein n=1 Tax=Carnegiea gigantea TaxID=171969 RepID=A0A9Q1JXW7_9CARY|nr:hypothetical protein Cgig2_020596 [Carnegiea gigantea]
MPLGSHLIQCSPREPPLDRGRSQVCHGERSCGRLSGRQQLSLVYSLSRFKSLPTEIYHSISKISSHDAKNDALFQTVIDNHGIEHRLNDFRDLGVSGDLLRVCLNDVWAYYLMVCEQQQGAVELFLFHQLNASLNMHNHLFCIKMEGEHHVVGLENFTKNGGKNEEFTSIPRHTSKKEALNARKRISQWAEMKNTSGRHTVNLGKERELMPQRSAVEVSLAPPQRHCPQPQVRIICYHSIKRCMHYLWNAKPLGSLHLFPYEVWTY